MVMRMNDMGEWVAWRMRVERVDFETRALWEIPLKGCWIVLEACF